MPQDQHVDHDDNMAEQAYPEVREMYERVEANGDSCMLCVIRDEGGYLYGHKAISSDADRVALMVAETLCGFTLVECMGILGKAAGFIMDRGE